MGSFSWNKADSLTKVLNVCRWSQFKFLIPKEFGGGFIKDEYQDYGYLGTNEKGNLNMICTSCWLFGIKQMVCDLMATILK
jgi:hypothetical protein